MFKVVFSGNKVILINRENGAVITMSYEMWINSNK